MGAAAVGRQAGHLVLPFIVQEVMHATASAAAAAAGYAGGGGGGGGGGDVGKVLSNVGPAPHYSLMCLMLLATED
jgi:hypothetical protein